MPSLGSITKTVRINQADLGVIEEIMSRERVSWSGAVHYLCANVGYTPKKNNQEGVLGEEWADTLRMLELWGIPLSDFLQMLHEALENGEISLDGGRIVTKDSLDLERLYDACHEKGIDPQDAIDKTVKMIGGGK